MNRFSLLRPAVKNLLLKTYCNCQISKTFVKGEYAWAGKIVLLGKVIPSVLLCQFRWILFQRKAGRVRMDLDGIRPCESVLKLWRQC